MTMYDVYIIAISLLIIAILPPILLCLVGCTSPVWENDEDTCLSKANRACMRAMLNNIPAGIVICTPVGMNDRHAVTSIAEEPDVIYYDPSIKRYRTREELGKIWWETAGPSKGIFDICPMPSSKR